MTHAKRLWSIWQALLSAFAWAFTRPSFRRFAEWITAMAINGEEHTITQSVLALERPADWKALESFAEYGAWHPDYVTASLTRLVETAPGRLWHGYHISAVDDTKVHRNSPDVWGTCTFHEYTARCPNRAPTVRAHNWVVLGALLDNPGQPPWCLPLSGRLYFRKSQLPLQAQDSDHTVVFRTKCELVVELIREQARITGGRHLGIFDGAYALRSVVRPLVQPEPGAPPHRVLDPVAAGRSAVRPAATRVSGQPEMGPPVATPLSGGTVVGTVAGGRRLHLWSAAAGPLEGTGVPVVGRRCGSAGQGGGRRG